MSLSFASPELGIQIHCFQKWKIMFMMCLQDTTKGKHKYKRKQLKYKYLYAYLYIYKRI